MKQEGELNKGGIIMLIKKGRKVKVTGIGVGVAEVMTVELVNKDIKEDIVPINLQQNMDNTIL